MSVTVRVQGEGRVGGERGDLHFSVLECNAAVVINTSKQAATCHSKRIKHRESLLSVSTISNYFIQGWGGAGGG